MVTPLTKVRKRDKRAYQRPDEIEGAIASLLAMPRAEILARLPIRKRTAPGFIPPECLVHLIRATRNDNNEAYFDALYGEILQRLAQALPQPNERTQDGDDASNALLEQVRDDVIDQFNERLAGDLRQAGGTLDIFECRFDFAVAKARDRAWRRLYTDHGRRHSRTVEALADSIEAGEAQFSALRDKLFSDPSSRMRLHAMIERLPETDRRILHMLIADFPIDSKKPDETSIRSVLGCDEKTVRNHRDAFIRAMQAMIGTESAL